MFNQLSVEGPHSYPILFKSVPLAGMVLTAVKNVDIVLTVPSATLKLEYVSEAVRQVGKASFVQKVCLFKLESDYKFLFT